MRKSLKVLLAVVALVSTSCSGQPSSEQPSSEQPSTEKNEYEPKIYESSGKILYGLYPQTVVSDVITILELNELATTESNGWYLYEGTYYAKQVAVPYGDLYTFHNGEKIIDGKTYWFKCEPIVWRILDNDNGECYVLSEILLDTHCYHNSPSTIIFVGETIHASNYEHSDIRTWLNNDFYNSAFALNDEYILTTEVDNSASTTNWTNNNSFACENTFDKVFLPSYQDYKNSDYGFNSDSDREAKVTDYARARGGSYVHSFNSYAYGNGTYWTRSPDFVYSDQAENVSDGGNLTSNYVVYDDYCVRPAITLFIS